MSQAREFCRELLLAGGRAMPKLARQYGAQRLAHAAGSPAYRFPDGSTVRRRCPWIIEATETVTSKFWIGTD